MSWKEEILLELTKSLINDANWKKIALGIKNDRSELSVHLAIFTEELMEKLIDGEKKLESRFSNNFISPHGQVKKGDLIAVKKSGGPVTAVFIAGEVMSFQNLNNAKINELKKKYTERLGLSIKDEFWTLKAESRYATLINVDKVKKLNPFLVGKKDRTAWVVIRAANQRHLF